MFMRLVNDHWKVECLSFFGSRLGDSAVAKLLHTFYHNIKILLFDSDPIRNYGIKKLISLELPNL
jgi:hypothetical protein